MRAFSVSDQLYFFRSTISGIDNLYIFFVCVAFFLVVRNFVGHCQRKIFYLYILDHSYAYLLAHISCIYCCFFIEIYHTPVFTERLCSQVDLFDYRKLM